MSQLPTPGVHQACAEDSQDSDVNSSLAPFFANNWCWLPIWQAKFAFNASTASKGAVLDDY